MIAEWLTAAQGLEFLRNNFGRLPYAQPGAAQSAIPLLSWSILDNVLNSPLRPDLLTVAAGRLVDVPPPRNSKQLRELMSGGISTVIRHCERHDRGLRGLATAFGGALPGEVHIQLYASPAGTHSFGWHYDLEDVFIAQTLGVKDYYMRQNSMVCHSRNDGALDFSRIREERSPMLDARLLAGDWLYIPRHWWHFVRCAEDSLSISVGILPPGSG